MKILKADRIIVGDGKTVYKDRAVAIDDHGKIGDIGTLNEISDKYKNADIETKDGCTLLPGLIDMHVHIGYYAGRYDADEIRGNLGHITLLAYKNMQDALSVGITTLRSVSEPYGLGRALRAGLHKGYIKGPRYLTCERGIAITGGHGTTPYLDYEDSVIEVDGPWEAKKAVRRCIKDGADWIKVLASHREHYCEFSLEEMKAMSYETHKFGKKCCIHAATRESIEFAVEAKFDTIEHGAFLTPDLAEVAAKHNIAWIPTAYIYLYAAEYLKEKINETGEKPTKPELIQIRYFEDSINAYNDNFLNNYKTGMLVGTGTDVIFPDKFRTPIGDEIKTLCKLGLSNIEAIKCATYNPAKILQKDNEFGTIKKGLCADILIVEGNPLEDIKAISNVKEVYKEGRLMYKGSMLKQI